MASKKKPAPSNVSEREKTHEKTADFTSVYANNVFLESSLWDVKLIFGQLDQSTQPNKVRQQVAVTLPWVQAKLLVYYLRAHLRAEEMQDGKIRVRRDVWPNEVSPPPEDQKGDAKAIEFYEFMKRLREEFIEDAS